ncbi:MAG: DUF1792 domain-containing protein [Oscillospiraceae bacterium]|nr:DUF1792 domain-containing protein [Oscillospiraceae bacterium]
MKKLKGYLLDIWYRLCDAYQLRKIRKEYALNIMTSEETISYIKQHNCSIARYGDGDLGLMLKTGAEGYQDISDALSEALRDVFRNASQDLLVCMPYPMISTRKFLKHGKRFWNGWAIQNQKTIVTEIRQLAGNECVFGDSFVSRPYTGYKSIKRADKLFPQLKQLWDDKDVLFVEGEGTRLGLGNDLFDNTKSIKRIIAPAENAFDVYDAIVEAVMSVWSGELVMIALGPTATVLACDLSKRGIQALDVGHIDIQYEWYLTGEPYKPVANKYVNETIGGTSFDVCENQQYLSQIVAKV